MTDKVSNEQAVAAFAELLSLRNAQSEAVALPGYAFCLQGRDGSGYKVSFGFETAEQGHAFHSAVIAAQKSTPAPQSEAVAVLDRDELAELISRAGSPPGPPDGPIRALPETHFIRVRAYKQADAVLSTLNGTHPAPPLAVTDEGWVLVPKVPTVAMMEAVHSGMAEQRAHGIHIFSADVWDAMLTAALEAKQ